MRHLGQVFRPHLFASKLNRIGGKHGGSFLAFLSEQSQFGFSKNGCKFMIDNNLRQKKPVVKKSHFEKQSQI
jgi:hypothetical protein